MVGSGCMVPILNHMFLVFYYFTVKNLSDQQNKRHNDLLIFFLNNITLIATHQRCKTARNYKGAETQLTKLMPADQTPEGKAVLETGKKAKKNKTTGCQNTARPAAKKPQP